MAYLRRVRQRERADALHELSKFGFLHILAPEHVDTLLSMAQPTIWPEGTVLAAEGEQPKRVMLVTRGEIVATSSKFDELHGGPGAIIGLDALELGVGMVLDGIPESFVIGASLPVALRAAVVTTPREDSIVTQMIPYTFIAGLFLSNFPEALASSASMRLQGWTHARIFGLWVSLMVITAVGAGLGYLVTDFLDETIVIAAEGMAAGAMLTMIAAAMIPEAVHLGSANLTGLSTLGGFLSAVAFKLLE